MGGEGQLYNKCFVLALKASSPQAGDPSASTEQGRALARRVPELLLHSPHNNVAQRDMFYGDINPRSNGPNASHHPRCVLAASITYTPVGFIAIAA